MSNILSVLKKDEKDYLTDDVVLTQKDQKHIYKKKQENDKKSKLYDVTKESKKIDNKIYLDNLQDEGERLDAECAITEQRIRNAKNNARLGRLDRAIDFNEAITENQKQDIKSIKERACKFSKGSTATGVVSAITTCISIGITTYKNQSNFVIWLITTIFSCVAIIFASIWANAEVKSLISFKDKFYSRNKKESMFIMGGKMFIILAYTIYSIWTNFAFWDLFFDEFGSTLFSIFFDITSIILAFEADKYFSLEFNDRYVNEINLAFESGIDELQSCDTDDDDDEKKIKVNCSEPVEDENIKIKNENRPFGENEKKTSQK